MKNSKANESGSPLTATIKKQRIRAPGEHGSALVIPPYSSVDEFWTHNRTTISEHQFQVDGQDIGQLRSIAREELCELAKSYTRRYRDVSNCHADAIILSGHQPRLFHPGVWYKNFALSSLGKRFKATAINLVVDNDLCGLSTVSVPRVMGPTEASTKSVAYDAPGHNIPFETREINDQSTFESFGKNLVREIEKTVAQPLVKSVWEKTATFVDSENRLGHTLAAARHALEGDLGLSTLEIPLSLVCQSRSFATFVSEVLNRIEEFREIYNGSIMEYRSVHSVRSVAHPVPELDTNGEWSETPFWIWSTESPVRRAMYVRKNSNQLEVSNLKNIKIRFDPSDLTAQIGDANQGKICIRPRALMTTMYSRMVLSDLFIHGIGGSKYDQLTDAIITHFWNCTPPVYVTATATFKLPFDFQRVTPADVTRDAVRLREYQYHPENFIKSRDEATEAIIADKQNFIRQSVEGSGKLRQQSIADCNEQLQSQLVELRNQTIHDQQTKRSLLSKSRVLDSRGYSFCLFDEGLVEELKSLT